MKNRIYTTLATLALLSLFIGCSQEEGNVVRSVEEVHESEGVPVNVRTVEPTPFRTYLRFTGTLSGSQESTATSLLSDEVAEVRFQVGDYVEEGTPVVIFPSDNPSLNYEQARASFQNAQQAFERTRRLYEDQGVSRQDFDNARTQYEIARANWESVQQMMQVRAPISGYITRINVLESDNVNPGDPLFTVSDYDRLKGTVWLTDEQIEEVVVGQPATAVWRDTVLQGSVIQVDMAMDQNRSAFAAKLRFENPDRTVRSGVTATIDLQTSESDETVIIRDRELRSDSNGRFIYTVQDGRAVKEYVEIGRRQGLYMEILSGLESGERVITVGMDQVRDGARVRIAEEEAPLVQGRI